MQSWTSADVLNISTEKEKFTSVLPPEPEKIGPALNFLIAHIFMSMFPFLLLFKCAGTLKPG